MNVFLDVIIGWAVLSVLLAVAWMGAGRNLHRFAASRAAEPRQRVHSLPGRPFRRLHLPHLFARR
jgi:hypothetical protein